MSLTLTKIAETNSTITLGWIPVPGAIGYRFTAEKQAKPSHTWDPTRDSVKFSKGSAWYKVEALGVAAVGQYPVIDPPRLLRTETSDLRFHRRYRNLLDRYALSRMRRSFSRHSRR